MDRTVLCFLQEKEFKAKIAEGLIKEMKKYNDSDSDAKEKLDDLHKKVHSHYDYLYTKIMCTAQLLAKL